MVRVGIVTARLAILVDHYHLTIREIGDLTDRQIKDVYFHARTKEGSIDVPVPTVAAAAAEDRASLASAIRDLDLLKAGNLITAENYEACVAAAREKYRHE